MKNLEILKFRKNFPILDSEFNNYKLAYLDNAAITQVPDIVINSLSSYYKTMNANIHRGVYYLSELSTNKYEESRYKIKSYINARYSEECIFVRGTTEAINLVANSFVKNILSKNDEILISAMEHHSNIVPWFLLSKETGAKLIVVPVLKSGDLDIDKFKNLLSDKTKILSLTHISNAIGTVNDIKQLIKLSHSKNIPVIIDGAQSSLNMKIDVVDLNCDFFTLSSHKMYGPNGVGVLYGKKELLEKMSPYQGGGDMIKHVSFSNIVWNDLPYKFEAGTPSISNVIAFGSCIDFLNSIDLDYFFDYKQYLFDYAYNRLSEINDLRIIGYQKKRAGIISFIINGIHPHDFGTIANNYGIAVRTGHHCAIPLMNVLDIDSTIRISFGFYNLTSEIDRLIDVILMSKKIFN